MRKLSRANLELQLSDLLDRVSHIQFVLSMYDTGESEVERVKGALKIKKRKKMSLAARRRISKARKAYFANIKRQLEAKK